MTTPTTRAHSRQPSNAAQTPGLQTPLSEPNLPPPETFDFLPPLHALLARILLPSGAPLPPGTNTVDSSEGGAAASSGHLDIKDLGTAVSQIKIRIQRARGAVRGMSDVGRSLEGQEEEIRQLEGRIERQRGVLRGLGVSDGEEVEVKMEGVEGE